jgi:hypothetical protein
LTQPKEKKEKHHRKHKKKESEYTKALDTIKKLADKPAEAAK